jgi:capsule polysaccharide export protein KpsE/RkpR
VFVLPMLIASVYLLAIAAPRYSSSTSFIVPLTTQTQRIQDPVTALAPQTGETVASDETHDAVNAYLTSRDVVDLQATFARGPRANHTL